MIKADLHIHTEYSLDCGTPLNELVSRCLDLSIGCIAVADHGTIDGAVKLKEIAPFKVIIAEEILTPHGEIMGMFLKEVIPSGLSVDETIARIKAQGGLVCIPHPFDPIRSSALDRDIIEELALKEQIDLIEVINSRAILEYGLNQALSFAREYGIVQSAGSDAHSLSEVGNAYIEMPEFSGRDDFLKALVEGKVCGHRSNPLIHFLSLAQKIKKRLR